MTAIQRMNPGVDLYAPEGEWKLPFPLASESKLEIHCSNDPNLPFELRLSTIKELSETDLKTRDLFVDVILENHTRMQNFEIWLAGHSLRINTKLNGPIRCENERVNRDLATEIRIRKTDVPSKANERREALENASGCWEMVVLLVQDYWSRFCAWLAGIFACR